MNSDKKRMCGAEKQDKKVSIIIPIYNISAYIDQAIESACSQTYKNIEVILVDDGSTDNSPEKCDAWAAKDDRIIVIHKENGGLSDARNKGLDLAKGDYIYFLDGDDYISPELVGTCVEHMDQGYDLVAFQNYIVHEDGTVKHRALRKKEYLINNETDRRKYYIEALLYWTMGWEAWNRMFRRDLIEKQYLRFEDNKKIFAEDLCFSLCYCLHASNIKCIEKSLYYYRLRGGSIMDNARGQLNVNRLNELSKVVYRYFRSHDSSKTLVNFFPAVHFILIYNNIMSYKNNNHLSLLQFRDCMLRAIDDLDFFLDMTKTFVERPGDWQPYINDLDAMHLKKVAQFWISGNLFHYFAITAKYEAIRHFRIVKRAIHNKQ